MGPEEKPAEALTRLVAVNSSPARTFSESNERNDGTMSENWTTLRKFADEHDLLLVEKGEVGFCRPCVGLLKDGSYIDYIRYDPETFEGLEGWCDERLCPPDGVEDAYHKHPCVAVLAYPEREDDQEAYDRAMNQLEKWVEHLIHLGVEVVRFGKEHKSEFAAWLHGPYGYCLRVREPATACVFHTGHGHSDRSA